MHRGIAAAESEALRRTLAAMVKADALRGARLHRCLGSALGTEPGTLTVLLEPAAEDDGTAALPAGTSTFTLSRCRPPSRTGFASYTVDHGGSTPVTAMVAVCSVYPEPDKRRAFHRWYNQHIVEVLGRGLFHTAHRYLALEPEPDGGHRHWALYEADVKDPAALPSYVAQRRLEEQGSAGYYPPFVRVLGSDVYEVLQT
jgi:hypothetical protein